MRERSPAGGRRRVAAILGAVAAVVSAGLPAGCFPATPSFERVSLERSLDLLREREVILVDAFDPDDSAPPALPGGIRWSPGVAEAAPPAQLDPEAPVLVVGSSERAALRGAAVLARSRNAPVFVFIPRDAEERSSLYALALQTEESTRGEDS